MQLFQSLDDFEAANQFQIALTIGNFDGFHEGHTHLLNILRKEALKIGLPTVLLTFKQHTSAKITPENPKSILTNNEQKSKLIKDSKLVDFLILQDFTDDFKSISGQDFIVEILVKKLKVKLIAIGENHRFGNNRSGDLNLLKNQATVYDFIVLYSFDSFTGQILELLYKYYICLNITA